MKVIEDVLPEVRLRLHGKDSDKPPQPIEKSTAGASLLAQVIVANVADHQPVTPAGEDLRAAWRRDLAQDHGRVDGGRALNCLTRCTSG